MNAGTISDTGVFGVYLGDNKTKVGELDEEFIFETRTGDAFLLVQRHLACAGNSRMIVSSWTTPPAAMPRMPFWNGDYPWRPYELGARIGWFRREVAEMIAGENGHAPQPVPANPAIPNAQLCTGSDKSARNLVAHIQRQLEATGVMASDTTIVAESFQDAIGEQRLVLHTPFWWARERSMGTRVDDAAARTVWRRCRNTDE